MEDTNVTRKAYGMFKRDGLFRLVEFTYNPQTLTVSTANELPGELYNQTVAIEGFKLAVVNGGVFDGTPVASISKQEEEVNE